MSTHTPGPWVWNKRGQLVAVNVLGEPDFDDEPGRPLVVIETDGGAYPPFINDRPLLAAAPDLLRVARDFLECLTEQGNLCECGEADCRTTRARAAIARATGAALPPTN